MVYNIWWFEYDNENGLLEIKLSNDDVFLSRC